jgi:DNA-binding protein
VSEKSNIIYIGRKPIMSYVLAVMTHLNSSSSQDVVIKARGRAITTAVDVAEVTRRRFINNIKVDKIEIGTEEIKQEDGGTRAVSTMEIKLILPSST